LNSMLPYTQKLTYLANTKLQTEIPHDLIKDIEHALYDYTHETVHTLQKEKDHWMSKYFELKNSEG